MKYTFHTCDVFTDVRFGGNPLAVMLGADDLSTDQMQAVAREFNLSETVFVLTAEDAANTARVRIFTPEHEMPFAGHPTIGSACVIAAQSQGSEDYEININLEQPAGLVPVLAAASNGRLSAQLVVPDLPEVAKHEIDPALVAGGLSLKPGDIGFGNHKSQAVDCAGNTYLFVPVKNRDALARVAASFPIYGDMEDNAGASSTVIYTRGGVDEATDFSSRMLAPASGVAEDPATGSAAAMFPAQLAVFENLDEGMHCWRIEQGYDMGRPSQLFLEADRLKSVFKEIRVAGGVVFVASGEIEI